MGTRSPDYSKFLPEHRLGLLRMDQAAECLTRTGKIVDRCYPAIPLALHASPFANRDARDALFSRERADYTVLRREKFKEIQRRISAKIAARDAALVLQVAA